MNDRLLTALKSLPLIRFALMLGGGMVASVAAGVVLSWLAGFLVRFPSDEAVWLARIQAVAAMGLAANVVVIIVMITLAWGKASGIRGSFNGAEVDVQFDEGEAPK